MSRCIKVFHGTVNYGTQAGVLAQGLRQVGVNAKSYTAPDFYNRVTDYSFKPRTGIGKKILYYKIIYPLVKILCFFRYNTFHFYFGQTLTKNRWDLPLYRLFGKKVVMEYLGNDVRNYQLLENRYGLPVESCFRQNAKTHDARIQRRIDEECKYLDYTLACLPTHVEFANEYGLTIQEILPIAINLKDIPYCPLEITVGDSIRIMHAPTNRTFKGTQFIENAIAKLKLEGWIIDFRVIENVSHKELLAAYKDSHIFIDQVSVGWYGTAALEAMAVGRPTFAFIDDRYFRYIDYAHEIPVINIQKHNIVEVIRRMIQNGHELPSIGERSRKFIETHHEAKNVAQKLKEIYEQKVWH